VLVDGVCSTASLLAPASCHTFHEVTDAYIDVRTWAVRTGHGLGGKDHEADRWVAAVALAARLPLATEDSIFDGVKGLLRADPESEP
jgi:predicted nucleic acid-binding protein